MLKKINRGLTRKDFENSRAKGRMYQTPLFGVSVQSSPSAEADDPSLTRRVGQTKVGFVISKKISKRAVERNRIKRLISEVIKDDIEKIQNPKSKVQKIIILVRKNILEAKIDDIEKCWNMVVDKLNSKS